MLLALVVVAVVAVAAVPVPRQQLLLHGCGCGEDSLSMCCELECRRVYDVDVLSSIHLLGHFSISITPHSEELILSKSMQPRCVG